MPISGRQKGLLSDLASLAEAFKVLENYESIEAAVSEAGQRAARANKEADNAIAQAHQRATDAQAQADLTIADLKQQTDELQRTAATLTAQIETHEARAAERAQANAEAQKRLDKTTAD